MASTMPAKGATIYNYAGVKDYPNLRAGADATARTLMDGWYPDVLVALRASKPIIDWRTPAIIREINKWGTHGFARELGAS